MKPAKIVRAFYNDDGSMGTALTLDELQSDWFHNLNRHNRKDLWNSSVLGILQVSCSISNSSIG